MTCTKCNDTGIYNEVLGLGFYYCRTCKIEIQLEVAPKDDRVEFDREYDTWLEQQQTDAHILYAIDISGVIASRIGYSTPSTIRFIRTKKED